MIDPKDTHRIGFEFKKINDNEYKLKSTSTIITKYLTRNPKLEASKELRELSKLLTTIDKDNFEKKLQKELCLEVP